MNRPALRPYQADGVAYLRNRRRVLLADDPGLGKTRQMIEASQGQTLVVAPAMVLDGGTWRNEIARWADDPSRFTCVAYTSLVARRATTNEIGKRVHKALPMARAEYMRRWDTLILDEAHNIKGRKTTWTAAVKTLAAGAGQIFLATGTPIPNWAHELFTLLQVLNPAEAESGQRLGSYWRWAGEWFAIEPDRYSNYNVGGLLACKVARCDGGSQTAPCQHYREFVEANLAGQWLRRTREAVLPDLPPLTQITVEVPMGTKQAIAYRQMKKDYLAALEDGTEVAAWTSSARQVKLDRCTTGLDLMDPTTAPMARARADNAKLNRLALDLAERSSPTLVMAHYRDTVDACAAVAADLGLRVRAVHGGTSKPDRQSAVEQFQAGKLDVLVGSLETLAEGLTLTAADMLIFVEQSWKPSRNDQAMRRLHRLGQTRPVTIYDYVTPNSVDAGKRALLATKTDHQIRILTSAELSAIL